jgi:hypothetical protein
MGGTTSPFAVLARRHTPRGADIGANGSTIAPNGGFCIT